MTNLTIVFDSINNGYYTIILNLLSFISIFCAVFVITTKNPIISVLYLIGLFVSISCYLLAIGLNFLGISYLLVYVGAVSILFLFILMLINIRVSELVTETKNSIALVFIVTFIFDSAYSIIFSQEFLLHSSFLHTKKATLSNIEFNNWENNLNELTHITSIGNTLYTNYSVWLILASIILLLAMVGAIVITVKQKTSIDEEKNIN